MATIRACFLVCLFVCSSGIIHSCNTPQSSPFDDETLTLIMNALRKNDVNGVLRSAELMYSIDETQAIRILNKLLGDTAGQTNATKALYSWIASFQRSEAPVMSKRILPPDPGLMYAQRIFDAIEVDNSNELVEAIESMICQIGLVPSLHIMNIMIANLASEALSHQHAYRTLKSSFEMLSPKISVKLPTPTAQERKKIIKKKPEDHAPTVIIRTVKVGSAAAACPVSQDLLQTKKHALKAPTPLSMQTPVHKSKPTPAPATTKTCRQQAAQKEKPVVPVHIQQHTQNQAAPYCVKTQGSIGTCPKKTAAPAAIALQKRIAQHVQDPKKKTSPDSPQMRPDSEWDSRSPYEAPQSSTTDSTAELFNPPPRSTRSLTQQEQERMRNADAYITPFIQERLSVLRAQATGGDLDDESGSESESGF